MKFFIFKTVKCISVKRFFTNTSLFLALLGTASPLKNFHIHFLVLSLHSTKNLNINHPRLLKPGK